MWAPQASSLEKQIRPRASCESRSFLKECASGSTMQLPDRTETSRDKVLETAQAIETDSPSKARPEQPHPMAPWRAGAAAVTEEISRSQAGPSLPLTLPPSAPPFHTNQNYRSQLEDGFD